MRVNVSGYSYGTVDNSGGTRDVTTSADCLAVFQNILQAGAPTIVDKANATAVIDNALDFAAVQVAPNCVYYYTGNVRETGDTVPMLTYNSATGTVDLSSVALP